MSSYIVKNLLRTSKSNRPTSRAVSVFRRSRKRSAVSKEKSVYVLLTKCEVKMAGYWPSSFLRVYGPRRSRGP